jgi:transposase
VLCVDEKSQIQALDRTAPMLPMQPGLPARRTHDYKRHGTSTLFAALEIATGQVTAACKPRHRHQEFLAFLKQVASAYPDEELHLVMDNYAAHKRVEVRTRLAAHPRITVHFTPTSGSWLNLVEVWFGLIERQALHRGTFGSVRDLNVKIRAFIHGWNDRAPLRLDQDRRRDPQESEPSDHFKHGPLARARGHRRVPVRRFRR